MLFEFPLSFEPFHASHYPRATHRHARGCHGTEYGTAYGTQTSSTKQTQPPEKHLPHLEPGFESILRTIQYSTVQYWRVDREAHQLISAPKASVEALTCLA